MALSLGAEGETHLEGGQWEASVNYRYLQTANGYNRHGCLAGVGDTGAHMSIHSIDVQATY
jgi:hypothetical protein